MQNDNRTLATYISVTTLKGCWADFVLAHWATDGDRAQFPRRSSLLARAMLRGMLSSVLGGPRSRWSWRSKPDGSPATTNETGLPGPAISLSHSGDWVACALSGEAAVGIDIEAHRLGRDFLALAASAFGPDETREATYGGAAGFYRIWTLREAFAKATGAGLPSAVDRVDRVAGGPVEGSWHADVGGATWQFFTSRPETGVSLGLALCLSAPAPATTLHPILNFELARQNI